MVRRKLLALFGMLPFAAIVNLAKAECSQDIQVFSFQNFSADDCGYTSEQIKDLHKIWKNCEISAIPVKKRPIVLQTEPTVNNLLVSEAKILRDLGL